MLQFGKLVRADWLGDLTEEKRIILQLILKKFDIIIQSLAHVDPLSLYRLKFSSHLTGNTLHLHYIAQPVNAV
jgi:hypothetical protein